jgi:UDP-glucose 4-epimerase
MPHSYAPQRSKSLVTGGAGFIGSHVAEQLALDGHEVIILDDLSGGFTGNVPEGARLVVGSVTDAELVDSLYRENRFDYVFHLAAYAAEGLSHFIRRFNYTNNLLGSATLVNAAVRHGCKCFVFTSSIAVYGAGQVPMREDTKPEPEDPYGIAKYAVELDLAAAKRMFGLEYVIFRPHNVYGERQNIGDKYRNVIGIFMNQVMQGLPCTIFGDGTQTRAFSYIGDVAPVIARSINVPDAYGEAFNIGADTPYTVREVAEMVQRAMGRHTGIRYLEARKEVLHAHSDHSKALRILNCRPGVSLEEGLRRMADWAWRTGVRASKDFSGIEVERNLPDGWLSKCTKVSE